MSFMKGAQENFRASYSLFWPYSTVVIVAYGFAMFNLTLVSDDWKTLQQPDSSYEFATAIGRWMDRVVWRIADDNGFAPAFTLAVLCGAYFILSVVCCLSLDVKRKGSLLIFACVLVCFPLNADPISFKMAHLNFALGFYLAGLSGLMIVDGYQSLLAREIKQAALFAIGAAIFFMLTASIYQPIALFTCAIALMRVVSLLRERTDVSLTLSRIALLLGFAFAVTLIGCIFYFATIHFVSWLTGVRLMESGTYSISHSMVGTWRELLPRINNGFEVFYDLLFTGNSLFPKVSKIAFLAATALLAGAFIFDWKQDDGKISRQREPRWNGVVRACILLAVILLLFLMPLILGMLQKIPLYRYNNLIGIALPHAMVYALLYETARDVYWRRAVAGLAIVIVGIFAFEQNRAAVTTFLLNRRDLSIASRMLERITANPAFAPFAAKGQAWLVFYGNHLDDPALPRPFSADQRKGARHVIPLIAGCGVFNCTIRRAGYAFRLISESRMNYQSSVWPALPGNVTTEERQRLLARINSAHSWPAPDSVIFDSNVIVIMLQPPG